MARLASLCLLLFLAACSSPPEAPAPLRLDYASLGKIRLDAQDLRIIDRAQSTPQWPPYVGHLFRPTLNDAVHKLAADRLQAAGTLGHATLIIKEANVTEQSLNTASDFESLFTRQQASKYIGRVEVSLEAQSPADASVGMATAHAVYAVTLPEDPTEIEKHDAYKKLLTRLMADLNAELERGVQKHMGAFLLTEGEPKAAPQTPTTDSALSPARR